MHEQHQDLIRSAQVVSSFFTVIAIALKLKVGDYKLLSQSFLENLDQGI